MDKPIKPYNWPKITISPKRDPIRTMAEKPTFFDSCACNLALRIDEIENGIIARIRIWRDKIPSEYFEKKFSIKKGANPITKSANKNTPIIVITLSRLSLDPIDSSESI